MYNIISTLATIECTAFQKIIAGNGFAGRGFLNIVVKVTGNAVLLLLGAMPTAVVPSGFMVITPPPEPTGIAEELGTPISTKGGTEERKMDLFCYKNKIEFILFLRQLRVSIHG